MNNYEYSPLVSIIILNWNGWVDTIECLESVYLNKHYNYNVIVVDNYSKDDSIKRIKEYCNQEKLVISKFLKHEKCSKNIKIFEYTKEESEISKIDNFFHKLPSNEKLILIKNENNYGFAEGNNIGIRYALKNLEPDYILLLNNDTIVDKNFLLEMIKTSQEDKSEIVGSKIYYYESPKLIQSVGIKIKEPFGEFIHIGYKTHDEGQFFKINHLDSISGCSMLIKREVFQKIGIFDPLYFLYLEDTDFCIRAKQNNFNISCSSLSIIWHKSSVSSKKISGTMEFYSTRNLFLFQKKNLSNWNYLIFLMYFFFFRMWLTSAIIIIYHKEASAFIPLIKDVYSGLRIKPHFID